MSWLWIGSHLVRLRPNRWWLALSRASPWPLWLRRRLQPKRPSALSWVRCAYRGSPESHRHRAGLQRAICAGGLDEPSIQRPRPLALHQSWYICARQAGQVDLPATQIKGRLHALAVSERLIERPRERDRRAVIPTTQSTCSAMALACASEKQALSNTQRTSRRRIRKRLPRAAVVTGFALPALSSRISSPTLLPWPLKWTIAGR